MAGTSTTPPLFKVARGVALEMPSNWKVLPFLLVKSVILPAKEMSKKHLAASAGFIKFWPRPP